MKAKAETKSITVGAKITPATRKKLAAIAKRRDRKLSHVINQILTSYVN
jgi:predicted transcriptional regulator